MEENVKNWVKEIIEKTNAYNEKICCADNIGVVLCDSPIKKIHIFKGIEILGNALKKDLTFCKHSDGVYELYFYYDAFRFFQLL